MYVLIAFLTILIGSSVSKESCMSTKIEGPFSTSCNGFAVDVNKTEHTCANDGGVGTELNIIFPPGWKCPKKIFPPCSPGKCGIQKVNVQFGKCVSNSDTKLPSCSFKYDRICNQYNWEVCKETTNCSESCKSPCYRKCYDCNNTNVEAKYCKGKKYQPVSWSEWKEAQACSFNKCNLTGERILSRECMYEDERNATNNVSLCSDRSSTKTEVCHRHVSNCTTTTSAKTTQTRRTDVTALFTLPNSNSDADETATTMTDPKRKLETPTETTLITTRSLINQFYNSATDSVFTTSEVSGVSTNLILIISASLPCAVGLILIVVAAVIFAKKRHRLNQNKTSASVSYLASEENTITGNRQSPKTKHSSVVKTNEIEGANTSINNASFIEETYTTSSMSNNPGNKEATINRSDSTGVVYTTANKPASAGDDTTVSKTDPAGDVYTTVNKPVSASDKTAINKTDPTGVVYTTVNKPASAGDDTTVSKTAPASDVCTIVNKPNRTHDVYSTVNKPNSTGDGN